MGRLYQKLRQARTVGLIGLASLVSSLSCSISNSPDINGPKGHDWYSIEKDGRKIWFEDTNDSAKPGSPRYNPEELNSILKREAQIDPKDRMLNQKAVQKYFKKHPIY